MAQFMEWRLIPRARICSGLKDFLSEWEMFLLDISLISDYFLGSKPSVLTISPSLPALHKPSQSGRDRCLCRASIQKGIFCPSHFTRASPERPNLLGHLFLTTAPTLTSKVPCAEIEEKDNYQIERSYSGISFVLFCYTARELGMIGKVC